MLLEDDAIVMFQGDSVTDAGRDYTDETDLGRAIP